MSLRFCDRRAGEADVTSRREDVNLDCERDDEQDPETKPGTDMPRLSTPMAGRDHHFSPFSARRRPSGTATRIETITEKIVSSSVTGNDRARISVTRTSTQHRCPEVPMEDLPKPLAIPNRQRLVQANLRVTARTRSGVA